MSTDNSAGKEEVAHNYNLNQIQGEIDALHKNAHFGFLRGLLSAVLVDDGNPRIEFTFIVPDEHSSFCLRHVMHCIHTIVTHRNVKPSVDVDTLCVLLGLGKGEGE